MEVLSRQGLLKITMLLNCNNYRAYNFQQNNNNNSNNNKNNNNNNKIINNNNNDSNNKIYA